MENNSKIPIHFFVLFHPHQGRFQTTDSAKENAATTVERVDDAALSARDAARHAGADADAMPRIGLERAERSWTKPLEKFLGRARWWRCIGVGHGVQWPAVMFGKNWNDIPATTLMKR